VVTIKIYIEGGVLENKNTPSLAISNTNILRQSFYELLTQQFSPYDFNLVIKMGSGEKQTVKFLKNSSVDAIALIDLDHKDKKDKLATLEASDFAKQIFFMVQTMEAWILSQPDKIELYGKNEYLTRVKSNSLIEEDKSIKDKHPESLIHPDAILKTILKRYFKQGNRKKGYGKLKDAPKFINLLELDKLVATFEDVRNMVLYINTKNQNK